MKYWMDPMSKNVVDYLSLSLVILVIPSRRQVDYNGGYVNGWTTGEFTYVNGGVPIERDHGGISQGYKHDDGMKSFMYDSDYLDIIHIDVETLSNFDEGLQETIDYINCICTLYWTTKK